ncbi:hypothetical protein CRG98_034403 [Punica granatum]|uniref:ATPase AAA-type core domain-containing protein n=1 Tax=Punica granatum TaxID=22663 RepID=A0A2I0IMK3_PUNGR|nr:hypothetical protein CRG98_034403 [Punica granatum]
MHATVKTLVRVSASAKLTRHCKCKVHTIKETSTKIGPHTDRLKIDKCPGKKRISIRLDNNEKLTDSYEGIELKWEFVCVEQERGNNRDTSRTGSDIRRFFELSFDKKRKEKILSSYLTLSGLLNFIDGLWSSCGDERIIIFTTNHVEKLDPALLRPGRMDMHIHMSYCTFHGFVLLASNYLGISEADLSRRYCHVLEEIKGLIAGTKINLDQNLGLLKTNDFTNVRSSLPKNPRCKFEPSNLLNRPVFEQNSIEPAGSMGLWESWPNKARRKSRCLTLCLSREGSDHGVLGTGGVVHHHHDPLPHHGGRGKPALGESLHVGEALVVAAAKVVGARGAEAFAAIDDGPPLGGRFGGEFLAAQLP